MSPNPNFWCRDLTSPHEGLFTLYPGYRRFLIYLSLIVNFCIYSREQTRCSNTTGILGGSVDLPTAQARPAKHKKEDILARLTKLLKYTNDVTTSTLLQNSWTQIGQKLYISWMKARGNGGVRKDSSPERVHFNVHFNLNVLECSKMVQVHLVTRWTWSKNCCKGALKKTEDWKESNGNAFYIQMTS